MCEIALALEQPVSHLKFDRVLQNGQQQHQHQYSKDGRKVGRQQGPLERQQDLQELQHAQCECVAVIRRCLGINTFQRANDNSLLSGHDIDAGAGHAVAVASDGSSTNRVRE